MNIIVLFFLFFGWIIFLPLIVIFLVSPFIFYLIALLDYRLDQRIAKIKQMPGEMDRPKPTVRFYNWATLKRGLKGKLAKACIGAAAILLLMGLTLGLLGILEILPLSSATPTGILLAIWYMPLIVGVVIAYSSQIEEVPNCPKQ